MCILVRAGVAGEADFCKFVAYSYIIACIALELSDELQV